MDLTVWGARGSVPTPGPETWRYGGNTSCVAVRLPGGELLVLDAGTGIRGLGLAVADCETEIHVLLTHLHLDHLQGLLFFAPLFNPNARIVVWGPAAHEAPLGDRIARYLSAPLTPVEVRELPCAVSFREAEPLEWEIGGATIRAASVAHRGPTLGYRVDLGGRSLAYVPDHEPGLGADLETLPDDWISGLELARDVDLLIHDCQYTDAEYACHQGWGHSSLGDALTFARRAAAREVLLFHHDPMHSDEDLDALGEQARERWAALGGASEDVSLAVERSTLTVGLPRPTRT